MLWSPMLPPGLFPSSGPLYPGAFASSTCAAWQLCPRPGSCLPRGFAWGGGCWAAVLCHRLSVCSLNPPPPGKLRAAFGRATSGTSRLHLAEWPGPAASWWPRGGARGTGVAGGVVAGTARARPLNVASVKFVGSVFGGGGGGVVCLFVFLNKCTKERLGLLSWSLGPQWEAGTV